MTITVCVCDMAQDEPDPKQLELDLGLPHLLPFPKFFGDMEKLRQLVEEERGNDGQRKVRLGKAKPASPE